MSTIQELDTLKQAYNQLKESYTYYINKMSNMLKSLMN